MQSFTLGRAAAALGLTSALTLGIVTVAVAHLDRQPRTDAATATFTLTRLALGDRTCTGLDGTYRVSHELFDGTATGGTARDTNLLGGTLRVQARSLVNQTTGLGTMTGKAELRKQDRTWARADLVAVVTGSGQRSLEGMLVGKVMDRGSSDSNDDEEAGHLLANFTATISADGTLSGQLGSGSSGNASVIQGGHCEGDEDDDQDNLRLEHRDGYWQRDE